jgi:hypothetical protein
MQFDLPPQLAAVIRDKVASGQHLDAAQVIEEAFRVRQERDDLRRLRAAVPVGADQIEQGLGVPWTPELHHRLLESALRRARARERPHPDVLP